LILDPSDILPEAETILSENLFRSLAAYESSDTSQRAAYESSDTSQRAAYESSDTSQRAYESSDTSQQTPLSSDRASGDPPLQEVSENLFRSLAAYESSDTSQQQVGGHGSEAHLRDEPAVRVADGGLPLL
jgi:hypothetical protein